MKYNFTFSNTIKSLVQALSVWLEILCMKVGENSQIVALAHWQRSCVEKDTEKEHSLPTALLWR